MKQRLPFCLCVCLIACGQETGQVTVTPAELAGLIAAGGFDVYRTEIVRFYDRGQFQLAWLRGGAPTPQALAIIAEWKDAASKGLLSADYDADEWDARIVELRSQGRGAAARARFDVALTAFLMRYVSDLHFGRVNPSALHSGLDAARDLPEWIRQSLVNAPSPKAALQTLEPPFRGYQRAQQMLQTYRTLAAHDDIPQGLLGRCGSQLGRLLTLIGDLPAGSANATGAELIEGIQRFQQRHGLDMDGTVGAATCAALNVPLSQRVRQLELTLERWRWAPHSFSRPPVVVNIPDFELRALDDHYRPELSMKVVVGRAYGRQTPVFEAEMKYLIFRPYWEVPPGIQRRELVPKFRKDPAFLVKNHYEIVSKQGSVVSRELTPETLAGLTRGDLRVRQIPGPDNALGGVKFVFPNTHSVYLHGTPEVQLFAKSRRDFSHGCIRVERPEDLALWVLRDMPEWTRDRIREAMNAEKPYQVNLKSPIPVLIVYGTAVVPESGEAHFYRDIYGLDAALEHQLKDRAPFGSRNGFGAHTR